MKSEPTWRRAIASSAHRHGFWRSRRNAVLLIAVIALGTGLRFYGLRWGLPYRFHVDEHQYVVDSVLQYWQGIVYRGDFNPHLSNIFL